MKKVFLTAFVAAAFAFGMASCNNNNAPEEVVDTPAAETEVCEHECHHECMDSVCAANNCETCTKKGTDECCKVKAGEKEACCGNHEGCAHEGCEGNHEGCAHQHEGCQHQCEHNK